MSDLKQLHRIEEAAMRAPEAADSGPPVVGQLELRLLDPAEYAVYLALAGSRLLDFDGSKALRLLQRKATVSAVAEVPFEDYPQGRAWQPEQTSLAAPDAAWLADYVRANPA